MCLCVRVYKGVLILLGTHAKVVPDEMIRYLVAGGKWLQA